MVKTKNEQLQLALDTWAVTIAAAFNLSNPSAARTDAIIDFCRSFVPLDTEEEDIDHFSGLLNTDDVCFIYICWFFSILKLILYYNTYDLGIF